MKRLVMSAVMFTGLTVGSLMAQDAAPAAAPAVELQAADGSGAPAAKKSSSGFFTLIFGSGVVASAIWIALFACGGAATFFAVDSSIMIRPQKVMPQTLIEKVKGAMAEGDVMKAIQACESEPGPMANILSAGFSHVEEGFDLIQEAIGAAADLETERIMQRLTWVSVIANISPMVGLLGTVQGMILAFSTLGTGAPDIGALALTISFSLWTTAAGLVVAIPAVTFFFGLRNSASRLILRMQAVTMELIKDLRNVEVVND